MIKERRICKNCNKEKEMHTKDGWCNWCYRKHRWKPKSIKCERCERVLPMHAKKLCSGCYSSTFHVDKIKKHYIKNHYKIDEKHYKTLTKECAVCGFDRVINLHHMDYNHENTSGDNLVGLCPNHHKMIHTKEYQKEIFQILEEKGFTIPKINWSRGFTKK